MNKRTNRTQAPKPALKSICCLSVYVDKSLRLSPLQLNNVDNHRNQSKWHAVQRDVTDTVRTRCVDLLEISNGRLLEELSAIPSYAQIATANAIPDDSRSQSYHRGGYWEYMRRRLTEFVSIALPKVPFQPWCPRPKDSYL
jgi:hypothetical protein